MDTELLEILPRELHFIFELKKQSSCTIQLVNKSTQYVAFKVKTTSPKKYCVRPNTGVIEPRSSSDFTVTMQAPRSAPTDLQCKDKFLVQSTVVPFGTILEEITNSMFLKESGQLVIENKLKVVLVSALDSPEISTPVQKEKVWTGVEHQSQSHTVIKDLESFDSADKELSRALMDTGLRPDVLEKNLKLAEDNDEMKLKLNAMELKLTEADHTIKVLQEERGRGTQEKKRLEKQLALLMRSSDNVKRFQVGFPLLYVCMVALISLTVGYLSHP